MPLTKLQFQPGINKETTSYSNEGGWFDMDKVRFRAGFPEKIGGWTKLGSKSFLGSCRALHSWRTIALNTYLGVGTSDKYYIEEGQGYYDITPIRAATAAGGAVFAATNGQSTVTITDADHGAVAGDFVTFSGAASLGGVIVATILNQEYKINAVVSSSTYTITAREVNTVADITVDGVYTPVAKVANGSDTSNGGGSVVATYQINNGLETSVFGNGWGAGTWGRGTWGSAATINTLTDTLRLWSHDNFGEDLIISVYNGGIFYWDASVGSPLTSRAVALGSLAGASNAPTIAAKVIVSDVDRHVLAFGCNALGSATQDPLLIRFSDQQNVADWTPTTDNTAGDLIVGSGSRIITAVETRQQILVFTDTSLHAMQYLGAPFTFGINMISENVTIASPNAVIAIDDSVFWMGQNEFYAYTGAVQKLPCTVKDYVFSDFNENQEEKVFAAANTAFSEVWWFYPSSTSDTVDRYVVYNYVQNVWYYGTLNRGAWIDRGVEDFPIAAGTDGYLYYHENGFDDGSTAPATGISAHIESSQFDIGDGNNFSFVSKIIPDVTFRNSTAGTPSVTFTMKARNFPGGNYLQEDDEAVTKTASAPVEQFTNQVFVRLRGRSMALRVESSETGMGWRLGSPRMEVRQDGRR
tara:strand:- start:145 stop:2064 length:1920 start_codon:yes stop_codon:yes gene_type:complete